MAGQLIWATRFKEKKEKVKQQTTGGKNVGGATTSGSGKTAKTIKYTYFANVAYALCEGPIDRIGTIWADGKKLKKGKFNFDVYRGTETQTANSLIANKENGEVPGYRGTAYIVFKNMPLESFGNRLPQLNFEVLRSFDGFEETVKAVTMIPALGEFAYEPEPVIARRRRRHSSSENVHTNEGGSDWSASIDQLEELLPNAGKVSLVVGWFGTDLRIGALRDQARRRDRGQVDRAVRVVGRAASPATRPMSCRKWTAARLMAARRRTPRWSPRSRISRRAGSRSPSIRSSPWTSPAGNALPDPYGGGSGQPAYPWRGRITCDPAPLAGRHRGPNRRLRHASRGLRRHRRAVGLRHRRRGGHSMRARRMERSAASFCITLISARRRAASTPS